MVKLALQKQNSCKPLYKYLVAIQSHLRLHHCAGNDVIVTFQSFRASFGNFISLLGWGHKLASSPQAFSLLHTMHIACKIKCRGGEGLDKFHR